jgi:hypothetical protein
MALTEKGDDQVVDDLLLADDDAAHVAAQGSGQRLKIRCG